LAGHHELPRHFDSDETAAALAEQDVRAIRLGRPDLPEIRVGHFRQAFQRRLTGQQSARAQGEDRPVHTGGLPDPADQGRRKAADAVDAEERTAAPVFLDRFQRGLGLLT
jgi:hypothetical protein